MKDGRLEKEFCQVEQIGRGGRFRGDVQASRPVFHGLQGPKRPFLAPKWLF